MLDPREAWKRLAGHAEPLGAEPVDRQSAAGRVLTAAPAATVDVPATDVSAMDGFAVAGDPPGPLRIAGRGAAGDPPGDQLTQSAGGAALKVMTGAPVPAGADRVIPVERATIERLPGGGEAVVFSTPGRPGDHIRRRGEVIRRGAPLLAAGSPLTPAALAWLASHGVARVEVHRSPRVAFAVTGDEVVPPDRRPAPGQLRDSHGDYLLAACRELGIEARHLGIVPDRAEALGECLAAGLDGADVLLLTGGVSKGELDLVDGALAARGARTLFDAVAVQPGKPLTAAVVETGGGRPVMVFGLPGNPGAVVVCFELFVRPFLRRLLGYPDGYWHGAVPAVAAAPLPGAKARDRFLPATLATGGPAGEGRQGGDACWWATPLSPIGSHDLGAYGRGAALLRIPAGAAPTPVGTPCEVLPLAGAGLREIPR